MFYFAVDHICLDIKSAPVSDILGDIAFHLLLRMIDRFAHVWEAFLSRYSKNIINIIIHIHISQSDHVLAP